ncbi:TPA: hypothetical protein ACT5CJ_002125 [Flavobacterium psychrophilum]
MKTTININIDKLMENFTVVGQTAESKETIKQVLTEALLNAVTDVKILGHDGTQKKEQCPLCNINSQVQSPEVECANKSAVGSSIETEIERGRKRLLHHEYKMVERVVLELKEKRRKPNVQREATLLNLLPRFAENFLNTLLVLQYLPQEQ